MTNPSELSAPPSHLPHECFEALLALADDELVVGHRHSEWLGLSPFLEEDLTLSSISQDEFGHARALYALIWPDWAQRDAGVTRRPTSQWRSCALTELEGRPWELSLVRHLLYDLAEPFRWTGIAEQHGKNVSGLVDLTTTVVAEERFHARHATDLVVRLAQDSDARLRLNTQLEGLLPLVDGLFTGMTDDGANRFVATVDATLRSAGLALDMVLTLGTYTSNTRPAATDRTVRSAAFDQIHAQLLEVSNFDPSATW
jgi:phenylacetate-CoA oxygenase PaaI subunit